MSLVTYTDRKHTDCCKWDEQAELFGQEGLHAMWVADMDFQAPPCVLTALRNYIDHGVFGYYSIPDSYYESFINWEKTYHGYEVKKEWLRFSPGVVSAFHWLVQLMTKPGDSCIVLTPVYYPFFRAIENNNRKLVTSDCINEHGNYSIDFEDFERKIIEHRVSLFILCSPHNPVGRVWTRQELGTLLTICRKHHVFVIADEIHHDITFGNHVHIPAATIGNYDDMLITITAPSKTFNLAGGQNSIVIIPNPSLRDTWDAFTTGIKIDHGNPFGYIASRAAYEEGRPWFEEVKSIIYENYHYMKKTFQETLPELIVSPLEGTYLAWLDFSRLLKAEEMQDFMQKKCNLAFDYGSWFGGEKYSSFIRMNLATSRENVAYAVQAIIRELKK